MIPVTKLKVGFYTYNIEIHDEKISDNHGETHRDSKEILLFDNGNEEVMRETAQHEALHALCEDIFATIKDIEKTDDQEEQFIRLFSPRLMQFLIDNPEFRDWLYDNDND